MGWAERVCGRGGVVIDEGAAAQGSSRLLDPSVALLHRPRFSLRRLLLDGNVTGLQRFLADGTRWFPKRKKPGGAT